jgi:hypothetical protein
MDIRAKRILIVFGVIFIAGCIALIFYLLSPKLPSTQQSDKTVIIDNYTEYTEHISSDSFGSLGNYLYRFINKPDKGVYHAEVIEGTYTYASDSWFSKFTVRVKDSDISWNVSLQTLKNGDINGDISVTCNSGSMCVSQSGTTNSTSVLQDMLPLTSDDYIISYQTKNYDAISIVYYDQKGIGKAKALEKIKSLGFKPEDYKIEYFYGGR